MTQRSSRTSAATEARMRASEDKMARHLINRGWFCERTGNKEQPPPGVALLATNGLRETYLVTGWTGAGEPILRGDAGDFVGRMSYLYTVAPALR